jgi:hypothetical protein
MAILTGPLAVLAPILIGCFISFYILWKFVKSYQKERVKKLRQLYIKRNLYRGV